jgi:hypothetical protein
MTDQVTSIEQSKRLIEMGVPAQKASMVWRTMSINTGRRKLQIACEEHIGWMCRNFPTQYAPAFTVADLLGIIKSINVFGNPTIEKIGDSRWRFEFGAITGEPEYGFNECQNIVELLVDRIEWVVSNGYELNLQ